MNYLYLTDGVDLKNRPLTHLISVPTPYSNGFFNQPEKTAFILSDYFSYLLSLIPKERMGQGVALLANISGCNKSEVNVVKCLLMQIQKLNKITFYCVSSDIAALMKYKFLKDVFAEVIFVPDASRLKKYIFTTQLPFEYGGTCYFNIFSWLRFMETFCSFEAYISKHFNHIMNAKEHIQNQNLGSDRVWYMVPISTTFDTTIIDRCNRILEKFENSQNYIGLMDIARNPAFQMARDKIIFYRSVLFKELVDEPGFQHLKIGVDINQSTASQKSTNENDAQKNTKINEILSKNNLNYLANASKLTQLGNLSNDKTDLENKLKKLLQNPSHVEPPPKHFESLTTNDEENISPIKSYLNETFKSEVYIDKLENSTQTSYLEPIDYCMDESSDRKLIDEHIDEINSWYTEALALFDEVDKIHLTKDSKIPKVIVEKAVDFCRKEGLDLKLLDDMESILTRQYGKVPQDWRILFYRVSCLHEILNNIRHLEPEEIEEVVLWRKQRLTSTKYKRKIMEPTSTSNAKSLSSQELMMKDLSQTHDDEKFDNVMTPLNRLLSDEDVEIEVSGREITMSDVDYDDLIDLISKEFATHGSTDKSTSSQQSFLPRSNVERIESERYDREDDFLPLLRSKDTRKLAQIEESENIPTNRYLEDYDFSVGAFKGTPEDDMILKIPEFYNSDHRHDDFRHLSPQSCESFTGKHFDADSPRSVDSGIWNTSPI